MNADLAARIQRAYPKGSIYEPDLSAFNSWERDEPMRAALKSISMGCRLRYLAHESAEHYFRFSLTHEEHPPFSQWMRLMDQAAKVAWMSQHQQPYTVIWLSVSRVADYFNYFYNHWIVRDDTVEIDWKSQPNSIWHGYGEIARATLEENGFVYCSDALTLEKTPFVKEQDFDFLPLDDPRWRQKDLEIPLVPSSVYECLFGVKHTEA